MLSVCGITTALRDEPWTRDSSSTPSFLPVNDFESRRRPRDPTTLSLSLFECWKRGGRIGGTDGGQNWGFVTGFSCEGVAEGKERLKDRCRRGENAFLFAIVR